MLVWHDIGIGTNDVPGEGREQKIAQAILERVEASDLTLKVLEAFATFTKETSFTLCWNDVPLEKAHFDYEQFARAMYFGFQESSVMTIPKIDEELKLMRKMGELKHHRGFSFFHSLDVAVSLAEQESYSRTETGEFIEQLLLDKSLYDPLYLREMLNSQRCGLRGRPLAKAIEAQPSPSMNHTLSATSINDERRIAAEFLAQRQKGIVLPQKLVVHSVDGQASEKTWRTYKQVQQRTANKLASIATYGLVTGGVVGGILPIIIHGTIDRADLVIMNWYPQYQGAILCPLDSFVQPGHQCKFTYSMSIMIDDQKGSGTDIFVGPAEKKLPYIEPTKLVAVVPTTLDTVRDLEGLAHLLKRSAALDRCIFYDPTLWGNFHHFNEWLQTTEQGTELLERKLERKLTDMKTVPEIKTNLKEGIYT